MSAILLDVNVLLALGWRSHQHFQLADGWFTQLQGASWVSCPITECGFLRVSNQPRFQSGANAQQIAAVLKGLKTGPGYRFWPDDYSPAVEPAFAKLQGHNQVTDAYLLLLAQRHNGRLATFDAGLKALAVELLGSDERVLLIAP